MRLGTDARDHAIIDAISGGVVAATSHQLREITGLSAANVAASLRRLRNRGVVTSMQRATNKPMLHFLAERTEEAMRMYVVGERGAR